MSTASYFQFYADPVIEGAYQRYLTQSRGIEQDLEFWRMAEQRLAAVYSSSITHLSQLRFPRHSEPFFAESPLCLRLRY